MYRTKVSDADIQHEKKWTTEANEALMEILEERRHELFGSDTLTPNMRMQIWEEIAAQMREKGFKQTTASCNKKYSNMRRTYLSNRKKNAEIRRYNEKLKPGDKIRRIIVWPYYERLGKLLKMSGTMELEDGDGSQNNGVDEDEDEEFEDSADEDKEAGPSRSNVGTAVNKAIRNLLQTSMEPVLILENVMHKGKGSASTSKAKPEGSPQDEPVYKDEPPQDGCDEEMPAEDNDGEADGDHEWKPSESINLSKQRISQRNLLRKAKAKRLASTSSPKLSAKRAKTGSDSRTAEAMVVEEVQGLRQEVRGINRNLEKLVDVHNRLNDNLERFLTAMRLRM